MTGYAVNTTETIAGTVTIELKSVNSRFLDLQFRINDELHTIESPIREILMKKIPRGKVECRISFGKKVDTNSSTVLHPETLSTLAQLQQQIHQFFPNAAPLTTNELLRWPGVITEGNISQEDLQKEILTLLDQTLQQFMDSRAREGAALKTIVLDRATEMQAIVERITPLMPQVVANFQQKSVERMQEALGIVLNDTTSPSLPQEEIVERIRQEVTLYGIRLDVAEELSRLATHLKEIRHIFEQGGPVGKRLDFMMQELNREANTLGSKAAIKELSDASIELKILIDQIREQVQNLE